MIYNDRCHFLGSYFDTNSTVFEDNTGENASSFIGRFSAFSMGRDSNETLYIYININGYLKAGSSTSFTYGFNVATLLKRLNINYSSFSIPDEFDYASNYTILKSSGSLFYYTASSNNYGHSFEFNDDLKLLKLGRFYSTANNAGDLAPGSLTSGILNGNFIVSIVQ